MMVSAVVTRDQVFARMQERRKATESSTSPTREEEIRTIDLDISRFQGLGGKTFEEMKQYSAKEVEHLKKILITEWAVGIGSFLAAVALQPVTSPLLSSALLFGIVGGIGTGFWTASFYQMSNDTKQALARWEPFITQGSSTGGSQSPQQSSTKNAA